MKRDAGYWLLEDTAKNYLTSLLPYSTIDDK
jgi:hypothetical protein